MNSVFSGEFMYSFRLSRCIGTPAAQVYFFNAVQYYCPLRYECFVKCHCTLWCSCLIRTFLRCVLPSVQSGMPLEVCEVQIWRGWIVGRLAPRYFRLSRALGQAIPSHRKVPRSLLIVCLLNEYVWQWLLVFCEAPELWIYEVTPEPLCHKSWDTPEQLSCCVPELGHSAVYHLVNYVRCGTLYYMLLRSCESHQNSLLCVD